jgi:uncharacterized glyoxalase superfamily protein PhnB
MHIRSGKTGNGRGIIYTEESYKEALGAEVTALMYYKDSSDPAATHASGDKVMHAKFWHGCRPVWCAVDDSNRSKRIKGRLRYAVYGYC